MIGPDIYYFLIDAFKALACADGSQESKEIRSIILKACKHIEKLIDGEKTGTCGCRQTQEPVCNAPSPIVDAVNLIDVPGIGPCLSPFVERAVKETLERDQSRIRKNE